MKPAGRFRTVSRAASYNPSNSRKYLLLAGLPMWSNPILGAHLPDDKPLTGRFRRADLYRVRKENPLPEPSPFWKQVEF